MIAMFVVVILASVAFIACIHSLMKRPNVKPVAAISRETAQQHLAMVWLVRAGEAIIIVPLTSLALMIGFGFVISLFPFSKQPLVIPDHPLASQIFSVIMCSLILAIAFFVGRSLFQKRADYKLQAVIRSFLRVTTSSVSTFSLVFAALAAHDVYQLMPAKHPDIGPTFPQPWNAIIMDRHLIWPLVFWALWRLVYVVLCRVLELKPLKSSISSVGPDAPDFLRKSPSV